MLASNDSLQEGDTTTLMPARRDMSADRPMMLTGHVRAMVDHQRLGYVATVAPDGTPHIAPMGTLRVLDERRLVFAALTQSTTLRCLRTNPVVAITVADIFVRKGYRFKGMARILESGEDFDQLMRFYQRLGFLDAPDRVQAMVEVAVELVQPVVSPVYERGEAEDSVAALWRAHYCD